MAKYIVNTRNLFLRSLCAVYMFAFCSLYIQIPGLYGERGILPAHTQLPEKNDPKDCFIQKKTLLCFSATIGLNTAYTMELIALLGTILSFIGDILLLEVGFLAIIVAPLRWNYKQMYNPKDSVTMWIIKWALFRLMFASGVVKLQSECPTWWGLTALNFHYESQCIPTPIAWFMHQSPEWWQKLCVVATYVIEIAIPFFFFSPIREHRIFAYKSQIFLQVMILLTGNYNFFNLTTLVMCISLIDDFYLRYRREYVMHSGYVASVKKMLNWILRYIGYGILAYYTFIYFGLKLSSPLGVDSEIAFSKIQFKKWIQKAVPLSIVLGSCSLLLTIAEALTSSLFEMRGTFRKLMSFISTIIYSLIVVGLFGLSLVPYTTLDSHTNVKVWPIFKQIYSQTSDLQITSSYGLFRHMTGVGGRPEVILEGADSLEGPWKEYEFSYKPGSLNRAPSFVAPHQPRVDWQMWFAALGTYHQNPWLISMTHRLLSGNREVTRFLDKESPWKDKPPAYIRGLKYIYHYTSFNDSTGGWWKRELEGEYQPVFSVEHKPLVDYLKKLSYLGTSDTGLTSKSLANGLNVIRGFAEVMDPHMLLWSLFLAALVLIYTKENLFP